MKLRSMAALAGSFVLGAGLVSCASAHDMSTKTMATPSTVPAAGAELPGTQVPWAQVGPGWLLTLWSPAPELAPWQTPTPGQPTATTARSTLYLVDPDGGRYVVTTFPPSDAGAPTLADWSGDGTHALLIGRSQGKPSTIMNVDLKTGATSAFAVAASVNEARYSRPTGAAILMTSDRTEAGSSTASLKRVDLSGTEQLTYPTDQFGSIFRGPYLAAPDGTSLVLGTSAGLVVMGNDGGVLATLSIPGESECRPASWWDGKTAATILASCDVHTPSQAFASRLWLVPVAGGTPTALTAPIDGTGPDLGDLDAWQLPSGTFVQAAGACGNQYLAKLDADGTTSPVSVPGVDPHSSIVVVGVDGTGLYLRASVGCPGTTSLVRYDPATNTSAVVLGAPITGGDVKAAISYGGTRFR